MGTINHTPDPTQGALIDASGVIVLPDDNEDPKGDNIQLGAEQLADWIAFRTGGPANDIDFKVTGNGTPPAGGYTPTTNPIIFKGTGVRVSGAPLDFASSATITGTYTNSATATNTGTESHSGVNTFTNDVIHSGAGGRTQWRPLALDNTDASITLAGEADYFVVNDPSNAATEYLLDAVSGVTGVVFAKIRVYTLDAGKTVDIKRVSDSSTIVTLAPVGAAKYYAIDLEYTAGRWSLGPISSDEAFAIGTPG